MQVLYTASHNACLPYKDNISFKKDPKRKCVSTLQLPFYVKTTLLFQLALTLSVVDLDCALPITSKSAFPTFLTLPVSEAQMPGGFTVTLPLHFQTLVADLDVQSVSFIGTVLHLRPLLTPGADVFALVVFPVFLFAEPTRSNCPSQDKDMYMGIIP